MHLNRLPSDAINAVRRLTPIPLWTYLLHLGGGKFLV
jgi:uncharacterized membrane protein YdjX (TVP38/TMEM64 family)